MEETGIINRQYRKSQLDVDDLSADPFDQFRYWFNDAMKTIPHDANAMVLTTVDKSYKPHARVVLLKGFDHQGFIFYTNYESNKGKQLADNPFASLVFYWKELERQIRIEGRVDKTSRKESDEYFKIRPEESNISAWASPQSKQIPSRSHLDHLYHNYAIQFKNKPLERPEFWGGYRLTPNLFEFWQGGINRLHDRFEYTWTPGGWDITRLAP